MLGKKRTSLVGFYIFLELAQQPQTEVIMGLCFNHKDEWTRRHVKCSVCHNLVLSGGRHPRALTHVA